MLGVSPGVCRYRGFDQDFFSSPGGPALKKLDFGKTSLTSMVAIFILISALVTACEQKQYTLKTSISPSNAGTVNIFDNPYYPAGAKVDIIASPSDGYKFDHWEGDVVGTTPSGSIIMDKEKSAIACFTFIKKIQYQLTAIVDPPGAGTVTPVRDIFDDGAKVSVDATALPGFQFDRWSGDIDSQSSSASIIMDNKKDLIAHFKPQPKLSVSIDPTAAGTVSPSEGFFDSNTKVTITAFPASGFGFDSWSGDATDNSNPQSIFMDKDRNLVAHFIPSTVDIIDGQSRGLISAVGYGSGYLNRMSVKITSNCKSTISVTIPAGIFFVSPNARANYGRMVNIESALEIIKPGESKQLPLVAAAVDGISEVPGKDDTLLMDKKPIPDDLKLLVKVKGLMEAAYRVQQYAVWVITLFPADVNAIRIGSAGKTNFQGPSQEEFDQIRTLYQQAGIKSDKYPLKAVNLQK
jgi:hypothetical protein